MRARAASLTTLVAALVSLLGCASAPRPVTTAAPPSELAERAATVFDAAAHDDVLRLKTLVDWNRWRLFDGLKSARDDAAAERVLSQVEAHPEPSSALVEAGARQIKELLGPVADGPMPPRLQPGMMNATLAGWKRGPRAGAPPALARLQTLVAEALDGAREVTYEGARRVTLVFVGDRLAGVLEAR
jgi:hypothetical protein